MRELKHVVIVGAGFAGLNCARGLQSHPNIRVTLLDKHNYQQFQPLLYQVAIAALTQNKAPLACGVYSKVIPILRSL